MSPSKICFRAHAVESGRLAHTPECFGLTAACHTHRNERMHTQNTENHVAMQALGGEGRRSKVGITQMAGGEGDWSRIGAREDRAWAEMRSRAGGHSSEATRASLFGIRRVQARGAG
eukprot:1595890-Rhodomonas_salina.1